MARRTRTKTPSGPVFYDTKNSVAILMQCHGSTWPKVIPWCIINVTIMIVLTFLDTRYDLPLALGESSLGHNFTGLIISFLLANRIGSALDRYSRYRGFIGTVLQDVRDLVQKAIVFSRRNKNNDQAAKEWRSEIAYRSLLMARTTAANTEFPLSQIPAYDVVELGGPELEFCRPDLEFFHHAEIPHSRGIHSFRVPLKIAQLIRETICSQEERLATPMSTSHEMNLLATAESILGGYHGIRNLMLTPTPFSLVQMVHTITIIYVFTLPLVFSKDARGTIATNLFEDCFRVFFITYGFLGLMLVSQELDDPFGDESNDFDVTGCSEFTLDDVVIMIHDADGLEWADALRYKMNLNASKPIKDEITGTMMGESDSLLIRKQDDDICLGGRASVPNWMV